MLYRKRRLHFNLPLLALLMFSVILSEDES